VLLSGCHALLPRADSVTPGTWDSFEGARSAIEGLEPGTTRRAELAQRGIEPFGNRNVVLLNYSEILRRFAPGTTWAGAARDDDGSAELDPGVRDCLAAPSECSGFEISVSEEHSERRGGFWLDFLNFRRETHTTGWHFNAIVLLRGDVVVYRTWGGEPRIDRTERRTNPLGPLQGAGERVPKLP
jgi:hypothetical protein